VTRPGTHRAGPVHPPRFDSWADARDRVIRLAEARGRLLVVSDFDGTLAPITIDPQGTRIVPLARSALRRLARLEARRPERLRVAILSGRSSLDVATRVRVGGLRYVGNHGLESGVLARGGRAERLTVETDPAHGSGAAADARRIGAAVATQLGRPAWLLVEDKGPAVAFHYRQAPDGDAARIAVLEAIEAAERGIGGPGLVRMEGRKVVELRPHGAGGKGDALGRLLAQERPRAALVLGDDRSDAEAFRVLADARADGRLADGLAVAVHGAVETPLEVVEAADLLVPAPRDAARLLSALAAVLERERADRSLPSSSIGD
jgi:trehalose 6-phosphate phosphatase